MINRGVVIVRPKKPYIDWALSLDDSGVAPEYEGEKTVYLVPEYGDDLEAMEVLSQGYEVIFEQELSGWHMGESAWPKKRTFSMFREWFDIEMHSLILDLTDEPLIDDEIN